MSREADDKIAAVLEPFGIPMAGNVWRVQGTPVVYHKTLEEIAAKLGILFQAPNILRAERDECVMMVQGSMLARGPDGTVTEKTLHEWSIGEALVNVNYRVSGKQAAYVYAMAEKRAKDRVILKLIGLAGHVYSEAEADEFKAQPQSNARQQQRTEVDPDSPAAIEADLRRQIEAETTLGGLRDLMLSEEVQQSVAYLAEGVRDDLRAFTTQRLKALGWKPRTASNRGQDDRRGGDNVRAIR
jgi:hypothetical protein